MKSRIVCIILELLAVASMAGVFILNYFGTTRMGMIRWLNSFNRGIESSMPLDFLKIIAVAIAAVILIFSLYLIFKQRGKLKSLNWCILIATILSFVCLINTEFLTSIQTLKIHYLACLLFFMSTLFLAISNIINIKISNS